MEALKRAKCYDLQSGYRLGDSKRPKWKCNPARPHRRETSYQLNLRVQRNGTFFYKTYEGTVKELEKTIVL
jgi:hypothetical protein